MSSNTSILNALEASEAQIHDQELDLCPPELADLIMQEGTKLAEGAPPLTPQQVDKIVVALRHGRNTHSRRRRAA